MKKKKSQLTIVQPDLPEPGAAQPVEVPHAGEHPALPQGGAAQGVLQGQQPGHQHLVQPGQQVLCAFHLIEPPLHKIGVDPVVGVEILA